MTGPLLEHQPDGSLPLVITNPSPEPRARRLLQPAQLTSGEQTCIAMRIASFFNREPPVECLRVIQAGDHYLRFVTDVPTGSDACYCAPCAIREWSHRGVVEAAVA